MKQANTNTHTPDPRTWIEVDTNAVRHNIESFKNYIGDDCMIAGVVKSNAYGHGLFQFSKLLVDIGVDWIIVDAINEAIDLRDIGITHPILVLGYTPPKFFNDAAEKNISLTISSYENIEALENRNKTDKELSIHIKINSGMNRQGFNPNAAGKIIERISALTHTTIEGMYTHFALATIPDSNETYQQTSSFQTAIDAAEKRDIDCIIHSGATAGTIAFPDGHFDMVRVGIGMYGLWPSPELKEKYSDQLNLIPALSWKSIISEIKKLPQGEKVGYDFTKTLDRDSIVAICPVGYWHGYPTQLSNRGQVSVNGQVVDVIGRISMNMMILDVTDVDSISVGDEVTLVGKDITADDIAKKVKIINYEVVTRINPLIERQYIS